MRLWLSNAAAPLRDDGNLNLLCSRLPHHLSGLLRTYQL